ncbi:MAG: hypothetical protein NTX45_15100 [Proteobacteria bacterium]|nr:hypothetical protein [Pseudomonadota bacterium]
MPHIPTPPKTPPTQQAPSFRHGLPEPSHREVNLQHYKSTRPSTVVFGPLPSMALDSASPWRNDGDLSFRHGLPEPSHREVNLQHYKRTRPSTVVFGPLPSMALDSRIPAGMTECLANPVNAAYSTPSFRHGLPEPSHREVNLRPGKDARPSIEATG